MIRRQRSMFALLGAAVAAAACQYSANRPPSIRSATAEIRSATGARHGTLVLEHTAAGLRISGALTGLPAGIHGMHFHQVGRCDAPDFTSAGPHLNPAGAAHGLDNPRGPHAGDLPNEVANEAGQMVVDVATPRVTLAPQPATGLLDADGTALVIHANRDDQRTDPAGNSGERIACGVITRT
jgi:superoxide dismutase, Cu-Zn family